MVDTSRDARLVAADLPCRRCGYNLRGLDVNGFCPECNSPVARALGGDWIRLSDPAWLSQVTLGAALLALATVCLIPALFACAWLFRSYAGAARPANILLAVVSLCGACGGWLLTAPDPVLAPDSSESAWAWRTRILLIAATVGRLLHIFDRGAMMSPGQHLALVVLGGAAGIATIAAPFALMRLVRALAQRIPDRLLAARANFLSYFCPVGIVAALGIRAVQVSKSLIGFRPLHDQVLQWQRHAGITRHLLLFGMAGVVVGNLSLIALFFAVMLRLLRDLRAARPEQSPRWQEH